MRIVAQRVSSAAVSVEGTTVASIGEGLCLLVGVAVGDTLDDAVTAADKIAVLRVFGDADDRMNLSLLDTGGEALVVSQFTLLGDLRRGRRPSFTAAAAPEVAEPIVERLTSRLSERGVATARGRFGARMRVSLVNEGPVTIVVEIKRGSVV
ncbi:MAG: D-aminoacyl-tRNA deacylase [Actinobacteria bacterium]|nr:D-aminoacyl-tRNA deacylase [Actinomycetota bacterium]